MFNKPILLTLLVFMTLNGVLTAEAAKKYYPPGFSPPSDSSVMPNATPSAPHTAAPVSPLEKSFPTPSEQPSKGAPQVIVKTITPIVKPKPVDPLVAMIADRRYTEALSLVNKRLKRTPGNMDLRLIRAQILRQKNMIDTAQLEYSFIVSHTRALTMKAQAYQGLGLIDLTQAQQNLQQGDTVSADRLFTEATTAFKKSIQLYPHKANGWVGLAKVALIQNQLPDAKKAIAKAIQQPGFNTNVAGLLTQAQIKVLEDRPDDALSLAYKAKALSPHDPDVSLTLAKIFYALNRPDDAIIQLQASMDKAPDNLNTLKLLSMAYQAKMRPDDAETTLQKAVSLHPDDIEASTALAKIYHDRQEDSQAAMVMANLVQHLPQNLSLRNALLQLYANQHDWDAIYRETASMVPTILSSSAVPVSPDDLQTFLNFATQAVYLKSQNALPPDERLQTEPVKDLVAYYSTHPDTLQNQRNLLLLNPLATIPASPTPTPNLNLLAGQSLQDAIELAFLKGDWETHQKDLSLLKRDTSQTPTALLLFANRLVTLNDYEGAQWVSDYILNTDPNNANVKACLEKLAANRQKYTTQYQGLKMIIKKVPPAYWQENARDALEVGNGNSELYALLAKAYHDAHQYRQAYTFEKLAAQYALSPTQKQTWLKKAQQTQTKLK